MYWQLVDENVRRNANQHIDSGNSQLEKIDPWYYFIYYSCWFHSLITIIKASNANLSAGFVLSVQTPVSEKKEEEYELTN